MSTQKALSGVLPINKPEGITSHDVVAQLRRLTGISRIGHTGTLDPFATGLLLVMIGSTTRLAEYAHAATKVYETGITLGATSTTDDGTGEITRAPNATPPERQDVEAVLPQFIGEINQVPPLYAAIKMQGKKLYEYARAGLGDTVPRVLRRVQIDRIEILSYDYPTLCLRVTCGSGTYIRALARDLGHVLGVGGYASTLERVAIGTIKIQQAASLDQLTPTNWQERLLPGQVLVAHLPRITISSENVVQLRQGRAVQTTNALIDGQEAVLVDQADAIVGIGYYEATTARLLPRKIL